MGLPTRTIYWFRRDLRTRDNRGLSKACQESDEVIPIYVFESESTRSMLDNSFYMTFLINAIKSLVKEIKLNIFLGDVGEIFDQLLARYKPSAVYTSIPLSWSERSIAERVRDVCRRHGVKYIEIVDNVLFNPLGDYPLNNFTSFYRAWQRQVDLTVSPEVSRRKFVGTDRMRIDEISSKLGVKLVHLEQLDIAWGERRLHDFNFKSYDKLRDYPHMDGVSRLSHFINLGVLPIREIYVRALNSSREYIRQLAWREYYVALSIKYPWMRDQELKPYMRELEWDNDKYFLKCFVEGKTGYPIVDAGIRQLKTEGWIHNRVRLIVASFLVKDLHIDWRIGAEFFEKNLVDYDEVLNIGNWQWAASVGVDPLPIRVFNPIRQAGKYDPMCLYIKKYLPELGEEDCRALHNPLAHRIKGYYEPIVDHYEAVRKYTEYVRKRLTYWRSRSGRNHEVS